MLILGDKPVTSRPIAAATVLDALPAACRDRRGPCAGACAAISSATCDRFGLDHASVEGRPTDGAVVAQPNRAACWSDSAWRASALAHWQPSDYGLVSLGGVAYEDEAVPSGSMLSVGFDYAQLDVGFRDHWLSPFTTQRDGHQHAGTDAAVR